VGARSVGGSGIWDKSSDIWGDGRGAPTRTLVPLGALGGVVGALLGGGTGTVTVPALDRLTDLRRAVIHGTATLPNVAVAVVGASVYGLRGGAIDARVGIPLMVGGVLGVRGGAGFVARASERTLRNAFVTVLILAGTKLLLDALGLDPIGTSPVLPAALRDGLAPVIALALLLGVAVGAWSAAMGLGGGLLTVPMLALLFGTGLHTAEGTSLVVMLPNSALAARAHIRQGTASVPVGLRLAAGAGPGALVGAFVALALSARALGLVFGVFVLFMAARELARMRSAGARDHAGARPASAVDRRAAGGVAR
jgi:uncharacterized protein